MIIGQTTSKAKLETKTVKVDEIKEFRSAPMKTGRQTDAEIIVCTINGQQVDQKDFEKKQGEIFSEKWKAFKNSPAYQTEWNWKDGYSKKIAEFKQQALIEACRSFDK